MVATPLASSASMRTKATSTHIRPQAGPLRFLMAHPVCPLGVPMKRAFALARGVSTRRRRCPRDTSKRSLKIQQLRIQCLCRFHVCDRAGSLLSWLPLAAVAGVGMILCTKHLERFSARATPPGFRRAQRRLGSCGQVPSMARSGSLSAFSGSSSPSRERLSHMRPLSQF